MSAVLASASTPVQAARDALETAQRDLASLDARIRAYVDELDVQAMAKVAHQSARNAAFLAGESPPKPPRMKLSDAAEALPVLRAERVKLLERVSDAEGQVRRACIAEVERAYGEAQNLYAQRAASLLDSWRALVGLRALLDAAGVGQYAEPLPGSLTYDFTIPAIAKMSRISPNDSRHFVASHAIDSGELRQATSAQCARLEQAIGRLPW